MKEALRKPLVHAVKVLAELIDTAYAGETYDDPTSRLLGAMADWVKANGDEI